MKIVVSHINGNAFVRAAAKGFEEANILADYYTTIATFKGTWLHNLGGYSFLSEIRRREYDTKIKPYTKTWPWYEVGRLISIKAGFYKLIKEQDAIFNINKVAYNFDKYVASQLESDFKNGADTVYCYEDTARDTFVEAQRLGMNRLYDLPIGYWRTAHKLLKKEHERWPEWIPTMVGLKDPVEKLERKDEEIRLANKILVASTFTANTLMDYPGQLAPVEIVPYSFPPVTTLKQYAKNTNEPLKLLFVGGLSQRKGIADLFAAVENIGKHVQLTIVGRKVNSDCIPLNNALSRHNWIPSLPHSEVLKLMRAHDVLVFPSLFEGFGLVITEAMSQGIPVITTDRTAGPDIIDNGKNGWIIEAGSTLALQEAIEKILEKRELVEHAGIAARETAKGRPWSAYSDEIAKAVL